MTVFDHDAADKSRAENPNLTIFDTGQALEPSLETDEIHAVNSGTLSLNRVRKTGSVTFTNDESSPVLSVRAQPSVTERDTTLVIIDAPAGGSFKIVLNDQEVWVGDADNIQPKAVPRTVSDLDGTVDAADWITHGHFLEAEEVAYLRRLVLPD